MARMDTTVTHTPGFVTMTREYWRYLERRDQEFAAYEDAGVDNWSGRDYAIDALREAGFYEDEE